jgi:Phosphotransferase enzyme family
MGGANRFTCRQGNAARAHGLKEPRHRLSGVKRQSSGEIAGGLERGGIVEEAALGTRDAISIDVLVDGFCVSELGSAVAEVLFRATSVGVVLGVRLDDGRRVVVKAHQPRESRARLQAVQALQAELFRAGVPSPEPLVGPTTLGAGLATAQTLIDRGEVRDTHDPTCRRLIAEALASHLKILGAFGCPAALGGGWRLYAEDGLWPRRAHAPMFDFAATGTGAEWIDALAAEAKPLAQTPGPMITGHTDWSGKHFRFADGRITAIYDWDSLAVCSEAVIVGNAAMTFTTNFDLPDVRRAPTPTEMGAFIDEYSVARSAPLTGAKRRQITACAMFLGAYTARCEHCAVDGYRAADDPNSFTSALRKHGIAYLAA